MFRCMDFTKCPNGWLQCTKNLGHPDRELHQVDISEGPVPENAMNLLQNYLNSLRPDKS